MGPGTEGRQKKLKKTAPPAGVRLLTRVPRLKRKMPAPEAAWMVAVLETTTLPWIFAALLPPLYPAEIPEAKPPPDKKSYPELMVPTAVIEMLLVDRALVPLLLASLLCALIPVPPD